MNDYADQLRRRGLKATPKRMAIIGLFVKENRILTPEEVWVPLRRKFGRLGLPSVYRNLDTLAGCHILTQVHQFDNKRYYALCHARHDHHHHHIVCTSCGKVGEFEGCALESVRRVDGFKVLRHFVQLEGICADCQ
ncbi:MAG: transcriptional repressor [Candidatus Omnitrophica bacterium]|nr:transcriptional repressor [Candidatus Omnitrophota bacterium]